MKISGWFPGFYRFYQIIEMSKIFSVSLKLIAKDMSGGLSRKTDKTFIRIHCIAAV